MDLDRNLRHSALMSTPPQLEIDQRAQRLYDLLADRWEQGARHIPRSAIYQFAFVASATDFVTMPYLDFSVVQGDLERFNPWSGRIEAITAAGTYAHIDFDGDEVTNLQLQPLRDQIAGLTITWPDNLAEGGRIERRGIALTLRDGTRLELPITRTASGAPHLVKALCTAIGV